MKTFRIALVALLAVAVAGFAAQATAAKKKPKLAVTEVTSPPAEAQVGDSFDVSGTVKNKGKKKAKKAKVVIRIDGEKAGQAPIKGKIKPKKSKSFSAEATVPESLDPFDENDPYAEGGPYKLEACVKQGGNKGKLKCKKAKGKITILPSSIYTPGARSLGDDLFPQIGNGGYDVSHYAIDLDYDPVTNTFGAGTQTTIDATATQNLSEFSFDFQDLDVTGVTVNGADADFSQEDAEPEFAPGATQPMKLTVTPEEGIDEGTDFTVIVSYEGDPVEVIDADTSSEGWIPACYPLSGPQTCDGAFVVNEPIGAQGWFPNNNYPSDKATYETKITVPDTHTAFGIGELDSNTNNGDGTRTWTWSEDDPTSTYLTTGTVGLFDLTEETMTENISGRQLDIYNGIDSASTASQKTTITNTFGLQPGVVNSLTTVLGQYPYDSLGGVADKASGVGYALEVATKAHYAGGFSSGNPSVNANTQVHEIAHQWMGNTVSPATWHEIWFNEGWAEFLTVYYRWTEQGADSPEVFFDDIYSVPANDSDWDLAPAVLDGDPANLFSGFAVYDRPGAMLAGYMEIVGENKFFAFARALLNRYGYGVITENQFRDLAVQVSGFTGAEAELLDDYFQEWLYLEDRPALTPDDF